MPDHTGAHSEAQRPILRRRSGPGTRASGVTRSLRRDQPRARRGAGQAGGGRRRRRVRPGRECGGAAAVAHEVRPEDLQRARLLSRRLGRLVQRARRRRRGRDEAIGVVQQHGRLDVDRRRLDGRRHGSRELDGAVRPSVSEPSVGLAHVVGAVSRVRLSADGRAPSGHDSRRRQRVGVASFVALGEWRWTPAETTCADRRLEG